MLFRNAFGKLIPCSYGSGNVPWNLYSPGQCFTPAETIWQPPANPDFKQIKCPSTCLIYPEAPIPADTNQHPSTGIGRGLPYATGSNGGRVTMWGWDDARAGVEPENVMPDIGTFYIPLDAGTVGRAAPWCISEYGLLDPCDGFVTLTWVPQMRGGLGSGPAGLGDCTLFVVFCSRSTNPPQNTAFENTPRIVARFRAEDAEREPLFVGDTFKASILLQYFHHNGGCEVSTGPFGVFRGIVDPFTPSLLIWETQLSQFTVSWIGPSLSTSFAGVDVANVSQDVTCIPLCCCVEGGHFELQQSAFDGNSGGDTPANVKSLEVGINAP